MKVKVDLTSAAENRKAIEVSAVQRGLECVEVISLEAAKGAVKDLQAAIRAVEGRRKPGRTRKPKGA